MIIGVDPGKNGGLVLIEPDIAFHYTVMPDFDTCWDDLGLKISSLAKDFECVVYLEDVHSIRGSSAKSNFQFGRAVGFIEGFFAGLGLPVTKVTPKEWQSAMFTGISKIKKEGTNRNDTKAMALEALKLRRPWWVDWFKVTAKGNKSKNVHDGLVDAALIALYGLEEDND